MGRKSTICKKGECRSYFPSMVIKGHGYWVCDTLVPWEILFLSYILKRWGVAICKVLFEEVNSKLNSESDLQLDYWSKRVLCWKQILEVKRNYFLLKEIFGTFRAQNQLSSSFILNGNHFSVQYAKENVTTNFWHSWNFLSINRYLTRPSVMEVSP